MKKKLFGLLLFRSWMGQPFWLVLCFVTLQGVGLGCNPANFFHQAPEQKTTSYRKVNFKCTGLHLSSSVIDVKTFRGMVDCFSPSGELGPIQTLVQDLSDADLQPIVHAANQYLFGDREALYKMEKSLGALSDSGLLDQSLVGLGTLLRKDLVSSSMALLKQGYAKGSSSVFRRSKSLAPQDDLLKVLELVADQLTPELIDDVLKHGLSTIGAQAFQDLQKQVRLASTQRYTLNQSIHGIHHFLQASHTYACDAQNPSIEMRRDLLIALREGGNFKLINEWLGTTGADVQVKLPRVLHLLQQVLDSPIQSESTPGFSLLRRMSAAVGQLNQPIVCPGASVPNGARHVMRQFISLPQDQLRSYVLEEGVKELILLKPMCELPPLDGHYRALMQLADQGAIEPLADMVKVFDRVDLKWPGCSGTGSAERYHPWTTFLTNALGDENFRDVLPFLESLKDLDVLPEFLLLASLPGEQGQKNIEALIQFMVRSAPELGGRSIVEVVTDFVSSASFTELFKFGTAVRDLILDPQFEKDPDFWNRVLAGLRNGMHVNNVHPVIELVKKAMGEATKNSELYDTLFKVADQPAFLGSIELLSNMAKSGELKQLLLASMELFHEFADAAKATVVIEARTAPAFIADRKHNWTRAHLLDSGLGRTPVVANSARAAHCRALDLDFSFLETSSPKFRVQYDHLLGCVGDAEIMRAGLFLRNQLTPRGESYVAVMHRIAQQLTHNPHAPHSVLSDASLKYFVQQFTSQDETGFSYRLLDAIPLFVGPHLRYTESPIVGSAVELLGEAFRSGAASLHALSLLGAQVLKDAQAPAFLADLHQIVDHVPTVAPVELPTPVLEPQDLNHELETRVRVIECWAKEEFKLSETEFDDYVIRRMHEIYAEPLTSVTSWKFDQKPGAVRRDGTGAEFTTHSEWKLEDLKELLDPIFAKAVDPTHSRQLALNRPGDDPWVLNGQLNFLKSFSGPIAQDTQGFLPLPIRQLHPKTPRDLLTWIDERSRDYRFINYYYEKYPHPRVRRVNTLTRLDLVLLATDVLDPQTGKNFSIDFLNEIAEAWGDVKPQHWPIEIREKVDRNPNYWPKTLKQAVSNIYFREGVTENLDNLTYLAIGIPERPSCLVDAVKRINPDWDPDSFYANTQALGNQGALGVLAARKLSTLPPYLKPEVSAEHFKVMQRKIYNLTQVRPVLADQLKSAERRDLLGQVEKARMSGILSKEGGVAFARSLAESLKVGTGGWVDIERMLERARKSMSQVRSQVAQTVDPLHLDLPALPYDGGLDTLRDLFFLVKRTTPLEHEHPQFIEQPGQELNNLYVILRVVKLGGLHQAGRLLSPWSQPAQGSAAGVAAPLKLNLDDPQFKVLNDFFAALVRTASAPEAPQLIKFLVGAEAQPNSPAWMRNRDLIWNVLQQVFAALDQGIEVRQSIRTAAFHGLAGFQQIQPKLATPFLEGEVDLMNRMAAVLDQVVREHGEWMATDPSFIQDLLAQKNVGQKVESAYQYFDGQYGESASQVESVKRRAVHFGQLVLTDDSVGHAARLAKIFHIHPRTRQAWSTMNDAIDALKQDPEYVALRLGENSSQLLEFFEHRGAYQDPGARKAADELRAYFAEQLQAGQVEDLLRAADAQPQGVYDLFVTLSHSVKSGTHSRLKKFMKMVREGLLEPAH